MIPRRPTRVLLTGWFSFLHGEATAGDVLAAEAMGTALAAAGVEHRAAWSPGFRPDRPGLDDCDPRDFSHLLFVCGPLHSRPPAPILDLHRRYADLRRIAAGVSVQDPADPAVLGFHRVLARDGQGRPGRDLAGYAAPVEPPGPPVLGVILTRGQQEYGGRRRHEAVIAGVEDWLGGVDAARLQLETRLDRADWRLMRTPAQLHSVLARLDAVVTNRLHGLVLALRAGVPAIAVDPVAGGAKVSAQAEALNWPAVLAADEVGGGVLDSWLRWCLGPEGRAAALRAGLPGAPSGSGLIAAVLDELRR
ncbi:polysaccharide pyruvyl transferase family protein [Phaeacidiphilus oryzae]|uniref:polysaccharide pyruvyl transferase family protein n=1 Tax=Phaeacidiphilus oryzae TaxID=348818 RepID=UPI00056D9C50|nr:polysaccharide pyruvyl transferase family protein [Phaeacidiphilus oryzae]